MSAPKVSVVMSVYNGERYLREAVESVLGQSFADFEFVIVDDGSKDGTAGILAEYAEQDARVRAITQENSGRAEALNRGIGLANGEYVARMDADDVALRERFKEQVEFLDTHADVGVLGGAYEQIDATGQTLGVVSAPTADAEIRRAMERDNPMCHPAVMMRREVATACGCYRKQMLDVDDYDLWLRMAERTQLANLANVVLRYRIHAGQVSVKHVGQQIVSFLGARKAAAIRREGGSDPLASLEKITQETLMAMGVSEAEIQGVIREACLHRMELLAKAEPVALGRFVDSARQGKMIGRSLLAEMLVKAAGVQYRQGEVAKAMASTVRALWAQPVRAGELLRMALERRAGSLGLQGWGE